MLCVVVVVNGALYLKLCWTCVQGSAETLPALSGPSLLVLDRLQVAPSFPVLQSGVGATSALERQ